MASTSESGVETSANSHKVGEQEHAGLISGNTHGGVNDVDAATSRGSEQPPVSDGTVSTKMPDQEEEEPTTQHLGANDLKIGLLKDEDIETHQAPHVPALNMGGGERVGMFSRAGNALASPRVLIKKASSALLSPHSLLKSASNTFIEGTKEVMHALRPGVDLALGLDVLGLPPPPSGLPPVESSVALYGPGETNYDQVELFEVSVAGNQAETLIAGEGITSSVLREGTDQDGLPLLDWAEELLLLTHEPLRRDMLEMQRALQVKYFGDLPFSWRVKAFFKFFNSWCVLVSQQHAVEVAVHYDWLVAPIGKVDGEIRRNVLAYHRKIELEMHSISRLENKILEEVTSIDTLAEPWSRNAQELRTRVTALCNDVRLHLAEQERSLPALLREHWGRVSPPQLVTRSLKAAKSAVLKGKRSERPQLIMWVLHYLRRRNEKRAKYVQAQLPMSTRLTIAMRYQKYADFIHYLHCIVQDQQPSNISGGITPSKSASPGEPFTPGQGDQGGNQHEKDRRAGMVNAMLAAANAERVDVPLQHTGATRSLAESQKPAYEYKTESLWPRIAKVPSNIYKKIGLDQKPQTPRRL